MTDKVIVMRRSDYELVERGLSKTFPGVEVIVSDNWVGPPRALERSEAEAFRSKDRLAGFRTTPVEM